MRTSRPTITATVALTSLLALFLMLPGAAGSYAPPPESPTPTAGATTGSPAPRTTGPTTPPTSAGSPAPGDTGSSAAPEPAPGEGEPAAETADEPRRSTDTEYVKVHIDRTGRALAAWLKDWIRLRGPGAREVVDPGVFASVRALHGTDGPTVDDNELRWRLGVGSIGYEDLYYEGRLQRAGDLWMTPEGPKALPVAVRIRYFTGDEGSEEEVEPAVLEATGEPQRFKIVVTLVNKTKRQEQVSYTDIQTKRTVVGVGPVYTPYVARILDMRFPDGSFDQIRTDGDLTRDGRDTVVSWTKHLVPPDYPARQDAIVTGVIAKGSKIPEITIVAQPLFPPFDARPLTSEGIQFERGRRTFFYDVFNLFRDNLIALTGLFGLLDDVFGNLAIPILGPEKGNREAGSFDEPNQLWALWTLTKGIEQLDRAMNVIENAVELSRDAVKGQLATLQQLRLLLGYSTDPPASHLDDPLELLDPEAFGTALEEGLLTNSIWGDLKQAIGLCGDSWSDGTDHYFPETPLLATPTCPSAAVPINLAILKLAILEHVMHALQKENHVLDTANLAGLAPLPQSNENCAPGASGEPDDNAGQTCGSYNKYVFIKFPFGLEELERGLHTLEKKGFEPLQAALGNKDVPNSLVWAMHVLTEGAEAQVDSFHQLGATWRYISDSIQNFAIFGVETSRNILQWDINAIDLDTAIKAAEVARAKDMATFMGRPTDPDGKPAIGQLVLTFSTRALDERPRATDTAGGKAGVVFASGLILVSLLGWARFRWFLI